MKKNDSEKVKRTTIDNLRFVLKQIWQRDKSIFFVCGLNSIFTALSPFIWIFTPKLLIDELLGMKRPEALFGILICALMASSIVNYLTAYLAGVYKTKIGKIRFGFISMMNEKAMRMDYKHTEDPKILNDINIAIRTVNGPTRGIGGVLQKLFTIFGNLLGFVGYIAIILTLNPLILLYLIANVVIVYFIDLTVNKYEKSREEAERTDCYRKSWYINSTMSNFEYGKDIRIYNMKNFLINKKKEFDQKKINVFADVEGRRFRSSIVGAALLLIREGLIYGYLAYRVIFGGLSIGNFSMYAITTTGFASWMENLMKDIALLQINCQYVGDFREFLDIEDKEQNLKSNEIPNQKPFEIELRNVSFKYPNSDKYIFRNLSLTIKGGQKIAIVGINGAGKTTLVKLLTRLHTPTEGEILLNGLNINSFDKYEYYKIFSVVFQDIKLFAFNIAENIAFTDTDLDEDKVIESAEKAGVKKKIDTLEQGFATSLLKIIDDKGIELSGGENQKLSLARALYKSGDIVILDEPTSALDPIAEHQIYVDFNHLIGDRTAIFISHRLSSTRFCDVIAFFEEGKIKEYGTHSELMSLNGKYTQMFNIQAQYYKEESEKGA